MSDTRFCDNGCGYKLPSEYAAHETTCGACLDQHNRIEQDSKSFDLPIDAMTRIAETQARYEAGRRAHFEQQLAAALANSDVTQQPTATQTIIIRSAADAAQCDVIKAAEEVFDGFFANDEQIDWQAFFDRLERYGFIVETTDSPAARKIQRHVRRLRDEQ